jgi:hemerythrin-like metal-binding protein
MLRRLNIPSIEQSIPMGHQTLWYQTWIGGNAMEFSEWVKQYSVGDALMDSYHHIFFQGTEAIEQAAERGDLDTAKDRLTFLVVYANMHFDAEEALLAKSGYPALGERHQAFRAQIQDLQDRMKASPSVALAAELAKVAREWWISHILHEDRAYASYMKAR